MWYNEGVRGRDVKPGQSTPDVSRGASRARAAAVNAGRERARQARASKGQQATACQWRPAGSAFPAPWVAGGSMASEVPLLHKSGMRGGSTPSRPTIRPYGTDEQKGIKMDAELAIRCFLANDLLGMVSALRPDYIEQIALPPNGALLTAAVVDTSVISFGLGRIAVHPHDTHTQARACVARSIEEVRSLIADLTAVTTPVSYGNGGYV